MTNAEFWIAYGKALMKKSSPNCDYCPLAEQCKAEAKIEIQFKSCEQWLKEQGIAAAEV